MILKSTLPGLEVVVNFNRATVVIPCKREMLIKVISTVNLQRLYHAFLIGNS